MSDAVTRYRAASEAGDIDALTGTLAADVELVSPISGRMVFRGTDDVHMVLTAVHASVTGLRWRQEVGAEPQIVVIGEGSVGPFKLTDAMVLELAEDGRIRRIRPHLRPWLAVTLLAVRLGAKLVRRPGVLMRAFSGA